MGLKSISGLCRLIGEIITGAEKHIAVGPDLHIDHGVRDRAEMVCNRTDDLIPEGMNDHIHANARMTKTHTGPGPTRGIRVINALDPETLINRTSLTGLPDRTRSARHWTKFPLTPTPSASIVGIQDIGLWNVPCIIREEMAVVIRIAHGRLISPDHIMVHNVPGHRSEPKRLSDGGHRNGRRPQSAGRRRTGPGRRTNDVRDLTTVGGRAPWTRISARHVASTGIGKTSVPILSPTGRVLAGCPKRTADTSIYWVCGKQDAPGGRARPQPVGRQGRSEFCMLMLIRSSDISKSLPLICAV